MLQTAQEAGENDETGICLVKVVTSHSLYLTPSEC